MAADERAIEVDGLAFQIPPQGVDALLRGEGVAIRLSGVNVRVSEEALNAILARLAPGAQPDAIRAKLSASGAAIDRRDGGKTLHLDVALTELRVTIRDGELRLESSPQPQP